MIQLNWVQDILIPFVVGVLIPFLTNWTQRLGWPEDVETLLNFSLSAAASVIINIQFDGNWKSYLTAFGVAWVGAMRGHYTGLPQMLYSNRVTGRHARPED